MFVDGLYLRTIPDFPNYAITRNGGVWSTPRKDRLGRSVGGLWLQQKLDRGYYTVRLYSNQKSNARLIHRLVLETFVGPCPAGMEACHNNGVRTDNGLENLRWDTKSSNNKDAVQHGTHMGLHPEKRNVCKLNPKKVKACRYLYSTGLFSFADIAFQMDISRSVAYNVVKGLAWKNV